MTKLIFSALLIFVLVLPTVASDQEDKAADAADAVAAAFIQARQAAHLSKLERMGRNTFRQRVCEQDMRMPSGWINEVVYQTVDPAQLPESAQQLASRPDGYKTAARFGIGVCLLTSSPGERPRFSVLIAIYESRWTSFLRIFWE
jgi:alkanesulfonate monooxygenase SsuD/methylene tetrahydromethanopterin reductase-like flavin-dependent oxidoreductase (luciferase family)